MYLFSTTDYITVNADVFTVSDGVWLMWRSDVSSHWDNEHKQGSPLATFQHKQYPQMFKKNGKHLLNQLFLKLNYTSWAKDAQLTGVTQLEKLEKNTLGYYINYVRAKTQLSL